MTAATNVVAGAAGVKAGEGEEVKGP